MKKDVLVQNFKDCMGFVKELGIKVDIILDGEDHRLKFDIANDYHIEEIDPKEISPEEISYERRFTLTPKALRSVSFEGELGVYIDVKEKTVEYTTSSKYEPWKVEAAATKYGITILEKGSKQTDEDDVDNL